MRRALRKTWVIIGLAMLLAVAATLSASRAPFADQLVRVSVHDALPASIADALGAESQALNKVFLAYSSDEALVLAARRAMVHHPAIARSVLVEYGLDSEFQQALNRFGADAVVPVYYFETNDLPLVNARLWSAARAGAMTEAIRQWWDNDSDTGSDAAPGAMRPDTISPRARAELATAFLNQEGYRFLDQFTVDDQGVAHWLQGERAMSALSGFFTGGLRGLERKAQSDEPIKGWDIASAGLDILVVAGTVKALRAGAALRTERAAQATRAGTTVERRALLSGAARAVAGSRTARWAVYGSTAWLVVTHPTLISSLATSMAALVGWPVWLMQGLTWFIVLLPALWLLSLGYRLTWPLRAIAARLSGRPAR